MGTLITDTSVKITLLHKVLYIITINPPPPTIILERLRNVKNACMVYLKYLMTYVKGFKPPPLPHQK